MSQEELEALGFSSIGENVQAHRSALFFNPKFIRLATNIRIDAFVVVTAGPGEVEIGRNVHIAAGCMLFGSAGIRVADFANLSSRVSIYSTSDDYSGQSMSNPTVPEHFKKVMRAPVTVGRHVIIAASSIILPGVTVGDYGAVGALSLVKESVEPFQMVAGIPARVIGKRSDDLIRLEREYLAEERGQAKEAVNHG